MRRKKKNSKTYEEDIINLASKEEEIINSYTDGDIDEDTEYEIDEEDLIYDNNPINTTNNYTSEIKTVEEPVYEDFNTEEEYPEEDYEVEEKPKKKKNILSILLNIILVAVLASIIMITIDVIAVARYNSGPYFAIPIHTYEDGGTIEYYGIGYKIIEYNQVQGRRDKEIGLWNLKYSTDPITLQDIDLAIEMTNNEKTTYEKYYKKFVRIISTLKSVDEKNHKITIGYTDEDKKYSLDIVCDVVKEQTNLSELEKGKEVTIIGTLNDFKLKSKTKVNRLYITNCFAEQ